LCGCVVPGSLPSSSPLRPEADCRAETRWVLERDAARVTKVFHWITLAIFVVGVVIVIVLFFVALFALSCC
jgi:hypothetical protein